MTRPRGVPTTRHSHPVDIVGSADTSDMFTGEFSLQYTTVAEDTNMLAVDINGVLLRATRIHRNGMWFLEWRPVQSLQSAIAQHGGVAIYDQ